MNKIIVFVGATGSGKTEWAKRFAVKVNGKIISADSRQIYKGMDIGTNKDKTVKQALIDVCEPTKSYSVADFQKKANQIIEKTLKQNVLPIIAGGSMMYVDAIIYGYQFKGNITDNKLRLELEKLSNLELLNRLEKLDVESYKKIDHKNRRRIIRAIEVSLLTSLPFSTQMKKEKPFFKPLIIGIKVDRETLYAKIDARVEKMIKDGLIEEVRNLIKKYGRKDLPAFNTIGYKEIIDYLDGKMSLKEAIEKIKTNTHAYVRRQDTWFFRNKDIRWFSKYEEAEKEIEIFLSK